VLTHHDAITGTSTSVVAKDYRANCSLNLHSLGFKLLELLTGYEASTNGVMNSPMEARTALLSEYFLDPGLNSFIDKTAKV
jgi:hypothetical protein